MRRLWMSLRTVTVIQAELDEARASLSAALKGAYRLDTGQSSQSVTRPSIKDLRALIAELVSELEEAQDPRGGVVAARMQRH